MAKIRPFKAIRPTRDKAYLVATRPYYMYKKSYLEAKLEENPYTFLHVINPEFNSTHQSIANTPERFQAVKNKFQEFIDQGIFKQDQDDSLYVYRQTKGEHKFLGVIAGASVEEYLNGSIKKHEETLTSREETFTNYLNLVEFNAEPVLLFHKKHEKLDLILQILIAERPEYEFTTTEQITHELWCIQKKQTIDLIQKCYDQIDAIYIADGHHRSASSARLAQMTQATGEDIKNYFLAFFISDERLNILDYNRTMKDLNGLSIDEFYQALNENFDVKRIGKNLPEAKRGEIRMYLSDGWSVLQPKDGTFDKNDPVHSLDSDILSENLLEPILGVSDIRTDDRIDFVDGKKGVDGVKKMVDEGKATVGFVLFPVSPEELIAVADANRIMPPKSTWIEPKLRSGLTIYPLNND